MNKFMKAAKIISIGLMVSGLSACTTTTYKSSEDWQGKLWRVTVVKPMVNTLGQKFSADYLASTKYVPTRDDGMRLARVHLALGWNSVIAGAVVPDNLEFSQLESGTVVDVMTELGPNIDYGVQRFTRILGVVCAKADKVCIEREHDAKRLNAVIDEKPRKDISAKYGATYSRRLTVEEVKKYD
jgi:hypothetical protein